jgi:hypothetical protein
MDEQMGNFTFLSQVSMAYRAYLTLEGPLELVELNAHFPKGRDLLIYLESEQDRLIAKRIGLSREAKEYDQSL